MPSTAPSSCTAFAGHSRIASGALADVALAAKAVADRGEPAPLLVFDDATSDTIELDLRGTPNDVLARLSKRFAEAAEGGEADAPAPARKAGRPKLGVVGREVTLLPRHWDWLAEQPGGASVAIRKLIEAERKSKSFNDLARKIQATTYRFINAVAGNFEHFEEVCRALFAGDRAKFAQLTAAWPADVRDHARWLMQGGALGDGAKPADEARQRMR
jgi:uncharacterized protein